MGFAPRGQAACRSPPSEPFGTDEYVARRARCMETVADDDDWDAVMGCTEWPNVFPAGSCDGSRRGTAAGETAAAAIASAALGAGVVGGWWWREERRRASGSARTCARQRAGRVMNGGVVVASALSNESRVYTKRCKRCRRRRRCRVVIIYVQRSPFLTSVSLPPECHPRTCSPRPPAPARTPPPRRRRLAAAGAPRARAAVRA